MLVEHVGDGDMEVMDVLLCGCTLEIVDVGADDFGRGNEVFVPALSLSMRRQTTFMRMPNLA